MSRRFPSPFKEQAVEFSLGSSYHTMPWRTFDERALLQRCNSVRNIGFLLTENTTMDLVLIILTILGFLALLMPSISELSTLFG